jgi:hypothetical protein
MGNLGLMSCLVVSCLNVSWLAAISIEVFLAHDLMLCFSVYMRVHAMVCKRMPWLLVPTHSYAKFQAYGSIGHILLCTALNAFEVDRHVAYARFCDVGKIAK